MRLIRLGFTGTQVGMNARQKSLLTAHLQSFIDESFTHLEIHHGDCVGADAEFHKLATSFWPEGKVRVVIHPPSDPRKRAFCAFRKQREETPLPYLERNHAIVDDSDRMTASPKGTSEELRSGTWATIRYARKQEKAIFMLWPRETST